MTGKFQSLIYTVVLLTAFHAYAVEKMSSPVRVGHPPLSASAAMEKVRLILPEITPGEGRPKYSKKNDAVMEIPLMHKEAVISIVRINPETGEIVPKGYRTWKSTIVVSQADCRKTVSRALQKISVGNPWQSVNGRWKVPLVLNGAVVAEVKVDGSDGTIIPVSQSDASGR